MRSPENPFSPKERQRYTDEELLDADYGHIDQAALNAINILTIARAGAVAKLDREKVFEGIPQKLLFGLNGDDGNLLSHFAAHLRDLKRLGRVDATGENGVVTFLKNGLRQAQQEAQKVPFRESLMSLLEA